MIFIYIYILGRERERLDYYMSIDNFKAFWRLGVDCYIYIYIYIYKREREIKSKNSLGERN